MKYIQRLKFRPCILAAIDPGVNHTGYAFFRHYYHEGLLTRELFSFGNISPPSDMEELQERAFYIAEVVKLKCLSFSAHLLYIEEPVIVYSGNLSRQVILSKASSVFKTSSVAYCILGNLIGTRIITATIIPRQWQKTKQQRDGLPIKKWSLQEANKLIGSQKLITKADENTADAINIGNYALKRLEDG